MLSDGLGAGCLYLTFSRMPIGSRSLDRDRDFPRVLTSARCCCVACECRVRVGLALKKILRRKRFTLAATRRNTICPFAVRSLPLPSPILFPSLFAVSPADGSGRTPTVGVPRVLPVVCACVPSSDAWPSGGRAARFERRSVAGPLRSASCPVQTTTCSHTHAS
eukprot:scaffold25270_cov104-Isochrysis_galbana.AAC.5